MAALVRSGEVSAADLVDDAVGRIERLNPVLNAVITPMFDRARQQAEAPPPGPFSGVPFLVKDLGVFIPGVRCANGSRALMKFVPDFECDQARAIREAGFIVLGKTNTPEFGCSPITNPQAFGPTRNPWRLAVNSAGSSGGSTAAVAARLVPMASSSDGGGSIRLPASTCGVFGFKPSRGLNPWDTDRFWAGAVVNHATTISVRDSAAYLDWTAKRVAVLDPDHPPPGSYTAHARRPPGKLRIGLCVESAAGGRVDAECVEAAGQAAMLLEELGHQVEVCALPYDGRAMLRAFLTVVMASTARQMNEISEKRRRPIQPELEPGTRMMAEMGEGVRADAYQAALATWAETTARMRAFHDNTDILLTPVMAVRAFGHADFDLNWVERAMAALLTRTRLGRRCYGTGLLDQLIRKSSVPIPFTPLANITGLPAMSVPLHWGADGLPIGVQFSAGPGKDGLLFSLAGQLEAARPWAGRRPNL